MQNLIKKKIAVVGCGPVGMFGSLLLEQFGMDYVTFEKFPSARAHPSAHWISANSKVLLHQIPKLTQTMDSQQENWNHFSCYRYVEGLCGEELARTDHFSPSIEEKLQQTKSLFGQHPSHMAQNKFLSLMYEALKNKDNVIFGCEVKEVKRDPDGFYLLRDQVGQFRAKAEKVIICNGVNSDLREKQGMYLLGNQNILTVVNIYFRSKQLAQQILKHKQQAMLHFIYGQKVVGILVNHSLEEGVFVMQIPNYLPVVDLLTHYSARQLLSMLLHTKIESSVRDIEVIHVGNWKAQGLIANKMYQNNIFLAGDSAHSFPPSGGFGMNAGIQDMHDLVHTLKIVERNPGCDRKSIYSHFCANRRKVNQQYLDQAMINYEKTIKISEELGYPIRVLKYLPKSQGIFGMINSLPSSMLKSFEHIREKILQFSYKRKPIHPTLELNFDHFDLEAQTISKARQAVFQQNLDQSYDIFVTKGYPVQKIRQKVGSIQPQNIYEHEIQGTESVILSNGNVLIS